MAPSALPPPGEAVAFPSGTAPPLGAAEADGAAEQPAGEQSSAAATAQPAKLNTLEKSKLDWETYKGTVPATSSTETMTDAERDELESQTRGGGSGLSDVKGYLHRKEFLDRVHNRLDAQEYDAHLS